MARNLNETFQAHPSLPTIASYSVRVSTTVTLGLGTNLQGYVTLLTGPSPETLEPRAMVGSQQALSLGVTVGSVISDVHQLYYRIPSGWYARLETSGNASSY